MDLRGGLKQKATKLLWSLAVHCYEIAVLCTTQFFMSSLEVLPHGSKADQPARVSLGIKTCSLNKTSLYFALPLSRSLVTLMLHQDKTCTPLP